jgi:predicted phage terminase large subunit-like protein
MTIPLTQLAKLLTKEKIRAEQYRRSFYLFTLEAFKQLHNGQELTDNWHIKLICDRIQKEAERIVRGEQRNKHLLINVPPRTLKSEMVNVFFSVYCWVLDPSIQFISSSYSASLSISLSTQARRLIESDWFKLHFPHVEINKDENTKSKYRTPEGGLRYSTSTGGTVTGMGGDIIVIDDPQNPQLARSEVERTNANVFFDETLRSRLNDPDKGVFIIIMQRLHEQDLTGHLLEIEPENWEHICLPAELSDNVKPSNLKEHYSNNLLFEARLSKQTLDSFKIGLGSYGYSGQYMQIPSPADGGIIKRDWFNIVKEIPDGLVFDFFIDTAYTDKTYNDATALLCACVHRNQIYVRAIEAIRLEFPELVQKIQQFTNDNGYNVKSRIYIEPKASGKSIVQQLKKTTGLNVIEDKPPVQDKVSRVNSVSAVIEAGRVNLLDGRYIDSFLDECAAFPNGAHDDQVDTLVMCLDKYTNRTRKRRLLG